MEPLRPDSNSTQVILLAGCLTFHGPPDPITRRLAEPAAQGQWDAILAAGLSRGLLAAVIGRLPAGAMIDADATALGTAAHTPSFILAQHLAAVRMRVRFWE